MNLADEEAARGFILYSRKTLGEERKLDLWRARTRYHLISVSWPLEVGRWHLDSFRISRSAIHRYGEDSEEL